MLERYLGPRSTVWPAQLLRVVRAPPTRISASKGQARLLSGVGTSAGSRRRQWPWYVLTFAGGFASAIAYKTLTDPPPALPLNPRTFAPYTLVSREQLSSTGSIFTLRPACCSAPTDGAEIYRRARLSGIWSVEVKQPQLQIARAYTPLPPSNLLAKGAEGESDLRFFIRRDPKGEVSGYLHKLPEGATIDLRGPHLEYQIPKNVDEVLFLAGGTGIAPALQAAHALLSYRSFAVMDSPKIRVLWANRRREDCKGGMSDSDLAASTTSRSVESMPHHSDHQTLQVQTLNPGSADSTPQAPLVKELAALQKQHPGKLRVEYFVDEENTYITGGRLHQFISSKIPWLAAHGLPYCEPSVPGTGRKLILVSGPDGFVEYLAGAKVWENGKEGQGSLGGVLSTLDLRGWEVWKL